ncbi:MAG: N-acetylmuramoyl-L-alanine amidase [Nitrospinae bacterium]|nr:N-acetylmuramoyl-L-alanine amidase [Nitrospinota bacterium]
MWKRCFSLVLVFSLLNILPVSASPDKSAIAYKKAADKYRDLKASHKHPVRKQLEQSLGMFKNVYKKYPRGSKTPEALYMSGLIHEELFRTYKRSVDRDNAITIYRVLVRSYPNNSLSDDALYSSGELRMLEGKNLEALSDFRGVLRWFPQSDSTPKARAMIANLEKEVKPAGKLEKVTIAKEEEPDFKGVRHFGNDRYARVVFDMSRKIHYRIARSEGGKEITVDLLGVESGPAGKVVKPQGSIVDTIQVSPLNNEINRVMISLKSAATYTTMELSNPQRIVVDVNVEKPGEAAVPVPPAPSVAEPKPEPAPVKQVAKTEKPENAPVAKTTLPVPKAPDLPLIEPLAVGVAVSLPSVGAPSAKVDTGESPPDVMDEPGIEQVAYTPPPKLRGIKTIVIDPGHGGKDPGAVGKGGLKEKDVVLDIALRLRRQLRKECDCRILMTRSTDVFIPLEERTAFANTMDADLFVSVHVNSNKTRSAKGVETYFLSPARSKGESFVAARENMIAMNSENEETNDLAFILFDMQNTDKINESSRMAATIQHSVVGGLNREYGAKDNGVKQAMFYVLHGAKMPSVLVETSFISNAKEEKLLRTKDYREEVAKGIARGILNYSKETKLAQAY